ncbi:MAG: ABC transporter permease [Phycisphaerae bacterium]
MNSLKLIGKSLKHYWRTNLGVLLGAVVASTVLVGALTVGDSVHYTLNNIARDRLGRVQYALPAMNRFFRTELADDMAEDLPMVEAMLQVQGSVGTDEARVNQVQINGVGSGFWKLGGAEDPLAAAPDDTQNIQIAINQRLANRLGVSKGDTVRIRLQRISDISRDAPLSKADSHTLSRSAVVFAVVGDEQYGKFSMRANQIPPSNIFLRRETLQTLLEKPGKANLLLIGADKEGSPSRETLRSSLKKNFRLADLELEYRPLEGRNVVEIRSDRVFLDPELGRSIAGVEPTTTGVFTYFVNRMIVGEKTVPYATVSGVGRLSPQSQTSPAGDLPPVETLVPDDMPTDGIVLNDWTAKRLGAKPGDSLTVEYYDFGPSRELVEESAELQVSEIVPLEGAAVDPALLPKFPGLYGKQSCDEWDPGIDIDINALPEQQREDLNTYWITYGGTSKGFVTLEKARQLWANRFGNLTAIRVSKAGRTEQQVAESVRRSLDPQDYGLVFQPVRQLALDATSEALDFRVLFVSLSFFLIIAAVLLTALLFVFGVEQRSGEIGTLLAIGFPPRRVRRLLLAEGAVLSLAGSVLGVVGGIVYTMLVLGALRGVWSGAIADTPLEFHLDPGTVVIGVLAGTAVASLAIWLTIRRQTKASATELLQSGSDRELRLGKPRGGRRWGLWGGLALIAGAIVLVAMTEAGRGTGAAGTFFGAGSMLLVGGLMLSGTLLTTLSRRASTGRLSVAEVGLRNSSRRRGRSLATIALLACGSFLIVTVGANRPSPSRNSNQRNSPTGGFQLYGELSLPIYHKLSSEKGRRQFLLKQEDVENLDAVYLRVQPGDDASCLNLNRAQRPRLLGGDPQAMARRDAFEFVKVSDEAPPDDPWLVLDRQLEEGVVPAIGDAPTLQWGLGKGIGDRMTYTGENGEDFQVEIVGIIGSSVLQGSLIISEADFQRRFPSQAGYSLLLMDTPPEKVDQVRANLTQAMEPVAAEWTPTVQRLKDFKQVENTYLSIFQILGGLGMVLGSIGLALVVLRNVLERRDELALLRAVGFARLRLVWMVLAEHWLLLLLGLVIGVISAIIAVLPALRSPDAGMPYVSLTLTLVGIFVSGIVWTLLASGLAVRGSLLGALRNE